MSRHPNPPSLGYQKVELTTNAFVITTLPKCTYYQYDVFNPSVQIRNKKIQLFQHLQTTVEPGLFNPRLVYDGSAIAYSPKKLRLASNGNGTFTVKLGSTTPVDPGAKGSYQITLNLTLGGEIEPNHVNDIIKDRIPNSTRALVATNLIQLVIRQGPNQHYTNNGRAYFVHTPGNQNENRRLDKSGLELWRGIFQSVRPTLGRMVLTIDTCTAAVYQSGKLIDICMNMISGRNVLQLDVEPSHKHFRRLDAFFKRLRIKVDTGGNRSRIRTIHGLVPQAGEFAFMKDDNETTVARHFFEAHGIKIQYPRIIGVRLSGKNSPNQDVVPLELCHIEPGQLFKRKIPEELTSDMVRFATMRPDDRRRRIEAGVQNYQNSEFVIESGMQVDTRPIKINAKLLNVPTLFFNPKATPVRIERGAWNALRQRFTQPHPLEHWAVLNFIDSFNESDVMRMMQSLGNSCTNLGMATKPPHVVLNGNALATEKSLNKVMETLTQQFGGKLADEMLRRLIIIVLLPGNAAHTRSAVKFWGDVQNGIATQCLRETKLGKANDQYWNNIALKLNARLGGTNFYSLSPVINDLRVLPYMIMGADVGHPGPGVQKPSVTSIVYSHDEFATQYVAATGIQPPRIEQILDLKKYVTDAITNFGMKTGVAPRRLIFFRDGLSEGEYEGVAAKEIQEIKDAFRELWEKRKAKDALPLLTFIVVGKRHHAVFFPERGGGDKTGNCHPGSLIDSGITHPAVHDFYLQSHAAIQGTCRSSHYIILHDENYKFELSKIQELAYTLCHVYAKATRTVSIPAPVYYADLVCSRGLFHVDPRANLQFDDSMSSVSGSSNNTLDMNRWLSAFMPTHRRLARSMYFL